MLQMRLQTFKVVGVFEDSYYYILLTITDIQNKSTESVINLTFLPKILL
jgi:hypothetical protein